MDKPEEGAALAQASLRRMGAFARALSAVGGRHALRAGDRELARLLSADLRKLAGEQPPAVVSIDIFDTLLLRNGKCEARRFWEISEQARERLATVATTGDLSTQDLFVSRYQAMRAGYACAESVEGCREGRIERILEVQAELLGLPPEAPALLLAAELDVEAGNLDCNDFLLEALDEVFGQTRRVGISDMYLGREHIEPLVARVCAGRPRLTAVFSSADLGVSKRSGRAYPAVAAALGIDAADALHIGDDVHADLVEAHAQGWRALLFPSTNAELAGRAHDLVRFVDERRSEGLACEAYATL